MFVCKINYWKHYWFKYFIYAPFFKTSIKAILPDKARNLKYLVTYLTKSSSYIIKISNVLLSIQKCKSHWWPPFFMDLVSWFDPTFKIINAIIDKIKNEAVDHYQAPLATPCVCYMRSYFHHSWVAQCQTMSKAFCSSPHMTARGKMAGAASSRTWSLKAASIWPV